MPILESRTLCAIAQSAPEALALARQPHAPFDAVLVESAFAGEEFLAAFHAVLPGLPVVLLGSPHDELAELRAAVGTPGLCGYLARPWRDEALVQAVDRAMALAHERRDARAEIARLRRRLDAAEVIHDLAVAASDRTSHLEILDLLASTLARLVAFDVCAIALAPPGTVDTALHLHRSFPASAAPLAAVRTRCLAELATRGGRILGEPTHIVHTGFPASPAHDQALGTELTLPIVIDDKVCGAVTLGAFSSSPGALDDDDREIAGQIVAQAAEAVHRLSNRLHDERRKMALMVESMADGVIMTDEKSEVFLINPAARRMLGVGRDVDVTAKYLKEKLGFYPFDLVARAHAAREELTIEQKTLHSIVSPVLDGIGKLVGVVVVLRDITAEKELEQRKQELMSIVSHELRTPLTSIAGALDIILASYAGGLSDKQRTYLTLARESCTKLNVMVNDLLDAARFEHGKLGLSFEPLQLDDLAHESVERFSGAAEGKRVAMSFTVERAARGLRIGGDADRLSQVLSNLLSNAIKFTPEGGRIEVEVFGPGAASNQVGVSVWNNGDPIPEEHHERVFEKFEQLHTSRRVGGTGLGLAISRSIIEGHGGKIWVEHAPVGTKFVFTLPAAPEELAHKEQAPAKQPSDEVATGSRVVLVVDDDRYAAYLLKGILMSAGHRVHVAHDLDDALGWARERKPDLVVTDARLGNAGLALVEILKHDPDTRKAGVIVLSAHADRERAQAAGADAYFPKPIQVEPFRQACARLLAEKTRESQLKVLVVDDEAAIRMICRDVLENAGYVVREAADGQTALAEAKRFRPDLMLLDINMPDLDGFATAKRFRADPAGAMTPVIFVSARSQVDDKVRAFKLGAEDYVVKPFDAMELLARVEKALARRERELGASPTTKLPGAGAIESEIERRLAEGGDFALGYVDLDNLKAFNDYYGIAKADGIIRQTGDLMREVVAQGGHPGDFIGHIAGDDFVFISSPDRVDQLGQKICQAFDRIVPLYYNKPDRERGYIETCDRYGVLRKFPIMSVSVAAITTAEARCGTYAELASAAADAKKVAKGFSGSSYVRDGALVHPEVAKSVA